MSHEVRFFFICDRWECILFWDFVDFVEILRFTGWSMFVLFPFPSGVSLSSPIRDALLFRCKSCLCHLLPLKSQRLLEKEPRDSSLNNIQEVISLLALLVSVPSAVINPFCSSSTLALIGILLLSLWRLNRCAWFFFLQKFAYLNSSEAVPVLKMNGASSVLFLWILSLNILAYTTHKSTCTCIYFPYWSECVCYLLRWNSCFGHYSKRGLIDIIVP